MVAVTGVMHKAGDANLIRSTWSFYWLEQVLALAYSAPEFRRNFQCFTGFVNYLFCSFLVYIALPLCLVVTPGGGVMTLHDYGYLGPPGFLKSYPVSVSE